MQLILKNTHPSASQEAIQHLFSTDPNRSLPVLELTAAQLDVDRFLTLSAEDSSSTSTVPGSVLRDQPFSVSGQLLYYGGQIEIQNALFSPFYQKFPSEKKRSFHIRLDAKGYASYPADLLEMDFDAMPHDPSLLRTFLAWQLASRFEIPGPRTTHIKVYLNEQFIGLYLLSEVVNEEFLANRFGSRSGILYKGNAGADLRSRGSDPSLYADPADGVQTYELIHSGQENSYQSLASFIRFLNTSSASEFRQNIQNRFDVEGYLRILAFETLFANWNTYRFAQQNYFLYADPLTGQFRYLPGKMDQVLGIWWDEVRVMEEGESRPIYWAFRDVYEWQNPEKSTPLSRRILAIEEFRHVYSYYLEYFIGIAYSPQNLNNFVSEQSLRLAEAAREDSLRTLDYGFTMNDFYSSLNEGVAPHVQDGLLPFMRIRGETAITQAEWEDFPPVIRDVRLKRTKRSSAQSEITLQAMLIANSGVEAKVMSRNSNSVLGDLRDDGAGEDQNISDDIYTVTFEIDADDEFYLLVSDVNGFTNRYPYRGDQFISAVNATERSPLVINELMMENQRVIEDEAGETDAWIELYNRGDESILLKDYFITNRSDEQLKWAFPDASLQPGEYLIIWADEQEEQGEYHARFTLDSPGVVQLYKQSGDQVTLQDSISYSSLETNQAFGRLNDGGSEWAVLSTPTPGFSNQTSVSNDGNTPEVPERFTLYPNTPNPFNPSTVVRFSLPESQPVRIEVFDITGKRILQRDMGMLSGGRHSVQLNFSAHSSGVYLYTIRTPREKRTGVMTLIK